MAHETRPGDGRTDAELFDEWFENHLWNTDEPIEMGRAAFIAGRISGTRPMPTDPEVAALKARVAELEAGLLDLYEATGVAGAHIPDAQYAAVARAAALLSKPAPGAEGGGK